MKLKVQWFWAVVAGILLCGCIEGRQEIGPEVKKSVSGKTDQGLAIADIINNQDSFSGREVIVTGKVMPGLAFEFISEQPYQIIQGEALLWVITSNISPQENSFVTVRGKIASPYQIKGRSYEIVLLEEERLQ